MYYTACLLLTIEWQLLCQAIVSLVYKWEGLLKIVWVGCNPSNPPPRSAPAGGHPVVSRHLIENGGPWGTGWGCFGRGLAPPFRLGFRSMEDIK